MTVHGKGLPFFRKAYEFGNLYIAFKVVFPKAIGQAELKLVSASLGGKKEDADMNGDAEIVKLVAYNEKERNTHATGGQESMDDSDEDDPRGGGQGGQRVQCAQQ